MSFSPLLPLLTSTQFISQSVATSTLKPIPVVSTALPGTVSTVQFLDRDHCILSFNERVLDWVRRPEVPVLERLRF